MLIPEQDPYEDLFEEIYRTYNLREIGEPSAEEYDSMFLGDPLDKEQYRIRQIALYHAESLFFLAYREARQSGSDSSTGVISAAVVLENYTNWQQSRGINERYSLPLLKEAARSKVRYHRALALFREDQVEINDYITSRRVLEAINQAIGDAKV